MQQMEALMSMAEETMKEEDDEQEDDDPYIPM